MKARVMKTSEIVDVTPTRVGDEVVSYSCKQEHTTRVYLPEEITIIDKKGCC